MVQMFDSLQDWGLSLLKYAVGPKDTTPPPFSQDVLKNVYAKSISWIWQRITSLCPKDLHLIHYFIDFQWSMQDVGCLVIITIFEFLCRKLNFVHVGIVQNSIFFIKSARHFRKTISTLVSQRVVWSLEYQDQWQCTFEFESYEWCGEKCTVGKPGA